MRRKDIKYIIEAMLFSCSEPLSIKDLNLAINEELSPDEITLMLDSLIKEYENENRGIQIIKYNDKYKMSSNEDYSEYIKRLVEPNKKRSLSQATFESLVIIAYKQPITKNDLEALRGVKCDKVIKTLLESNMIYEAGRVNKTGKPILYRTTDEFLKLIGINSIYDLPKLDKKI